MHSVLVFDSGVGGLSVVDALRRANLALDIDYAADAAWLPYGLKSDEDLRARVPALLSAVSRQWRPDLVIIACNTASTIALDSVRAALAVPVVGVVPPIKPAAALTQSGVIGLLATPATIARAYTDKLIADFAPNARVIRVGSAELVAAAEAKARGEAAPRSPVEDAIASLFAGPDGARLDVVALACTHFPLLIEELAAAAPRACAWLDSGAAIARRVAGLLQAPAGTAALRRAGATGAGEALASFARYGFAQCCTLGPEPDFTARSP
jgi:glutamate racemase